MVLRSRFFAQYALISSLTRPKATRLSRYLPNDAELMVIFKSDRPGRGPESVDLPDPAWGPARRWHDVIGLAQHQSGEDA